MKNIRTPHQQNVHPSNIKSCIRARQEFVITLDWYGTQCQYEYNISNGQKVVSNIYNNNKASNAKISQNVNKAVYFFARFFRVNLVVWFNSILPKYTSALLFSGINPSSEPHRELFVGWRCTSLMTYMGGNSHCDCPGLNNSNTKIK